LMQVDSTGQSQTKKNTRRRAGNPQSGIIIHQTDQTVPLTVILKTLEGKEVQITRDSLHAAGWNALKEFEMHGDASREQLHLTPAQQDSIRTLQEKQANEMREALKRKYPNLQTK
jgi:hypothetical protein